MKGSKFTFALAGLCCIFIGPMSIAQQNTDDDPMEVLAKRLAERLMAKERPRVTVLDFTDMQNRPNELGRYMALQLANELVNLTDVSVIDRANLEIIMAEHKLTAEGLLRPEDAKKLGQFAGVDAIVIGNVSPIGDNIEIIVRAISTETSEVVAGGKASFPATHEFRRMLELNVASSGPRGPGPSRTTTVEGEAIAITEIGPIVAVLRNVAKHSVQTRQGAAPAIRCTFDLENRNLQRSVAVAANRRLLEPSRPTRFESTTRFRGELSGSHGVRWILAAVTSVSAVVCFEGEDEVAWAQGSPANPSAIVDYVRSGKRYITDQSETMRTGRYWFGSFSSIPPGEKIRMTVDFVPAAAYDRGGRTDVSPPDHFQFDMELVLGTYVKGEDPAKAKDLMLRNLTIDRVVLDNQPASSGR
jgi:TolB-like protein